MESTRNQLIELLEENKDTYISGQELSRKLNISRTAVWKHMKGLEKDGYTIQAIPRKGYQITEFPNKISNNTIQWGLHTKWLGKQLVHKQQVDSTQAMGHQLALTNADHGTVIIADEQTNGKGRMDREWYSLKDQGIWMSIILKPKIIPNQAAQITLLTATVLAEVINESFTIRPSIKWPNDIYLCNKKVAGILTEMKAEQDQINYLIVGIGINVNHTKEMLPDDIRDKATSIRMETEKTVDRRLMIQQLLEKFEQSYDQFTSLGFTTVKETWEKFGYKLGEKVTINTFNNQKEVKLIGIQKDGALIVENKDGVLETIYSAEINW